jgi:hypothetical protein
MNEIKYTILYYVFVRTFVIAFYYGSGTVINYSSGSGSEFLSSYSSGSTTLSVLMIFFQLVSYAMPYLEQLGEMLEREERGTVYNYLMWRVVMELMPYLPLRSSETSKH